MEYRFRGAISYILGQTEQICATGKYCLPSSAPHDVLPLLFFRGPTVTEMDRIRQDLWHPTLDASNYPDSAYQRDLMEQYRICLEMADRISARRGSANAFFLTFNTAIVGALGAFFGAFSHAVPDMVAVTMFIVAIAFCVAWAVLLRSYRNLNTAKFKVIGLLEEKLPASPLYAAEWNALGAGKDWSKYIPLSLVEKILPTVFVIAYIVLAVVTLTTDPVSLTG